VVSKLARHSALCRTGMIATNMFIFVSFRGRVPNRSRTITLPLKKTLIFRTMDPLSANAHGTSCSSTNTRANVVIDCYHKASEISPSPTWKVLCQFSTSSGQMSWCMDCFRMRPWPHKLGAFPIFYTCPFRFGKRSSYSSSLTRIPMPTVPIPASVPTLETLVDILPYSNHHSWRRHLRADGRQLLLMLLPLHPARAAPFTGLIIT
jgi:hypothetical protein